MHNSSYANPRQTRNKMQRFVGWVCDDTLAAAAVRLGILGLIAGILVAIIEVFLP